MSKIGRPGKIRSFETQGLDNFIYFLELYSISPITEMKSGTGQGLLALDPAPQLEFGVGLHSHTAATA